MNVRKTDDFIADVERPVRVQLEEPLMQDLQVCVGDRSPPSRRDAPEEAEPGDLGNQLGRGGPLLEVIADRRQDAGIDERADGVADGALFRGEVAGEIEEVGHRPQA